MSKIKDQLLTETTIPKTESNNNTPAVQYADPWLEVAAETGSDMGQLLKFVKGKWKIDEDEIPQGTEYVAHIDQLARGWAKFEDGELVDLKIKRIADGELPARETLGDLDPTKWKEKDETGKPKDPWSRQWYLPLVSVDLGEICTFVTHTNGGDRVIGNLCRIFSNNRQHGLPIIELKARSYKHRKYGDVDVPIFGLAGWHRSGQSKMTATPPKTGSAAVNYDDISNEVDQTPFWER